MPESNVERFWCPRDGSYSLDDDGFLRDPDASFLGMGSVNPGALRGDDLRSVRCLVLLGEPGSGKSTVIRDDPVAPAGWRFLRIDLAAYGSEDRLVREVFQCAEVISWTGTDDQLCVVLDSFDEARARMPHLATLIADELRKLPVDRLALRLACRTADWPPSLEQALGQMFEEVAVVEILPLRCVDASSIAGTWCDASQLLDEVRRVGAGPLAARPLTLRFLAQGFAEAGMLPDPGPGMYAAGVRSLCEEQNPGRRDAGLLGTAEVEERVAVARRIAAATVFGGAASVWIGTDVDSDGADLRLSDLAGMTEPTATGHVAPTRSAVMEVLGTGLFTSRGARRLGWAHATFADYLAAEWVVRNELSVAQARPLFLGPDGRCWPQTRLAASWAVAIAPDRFGFLARADPQAFQGEVDLPGDELRREVIDGLFAAASSLTSGPWHRPYRGLRHDGIAAQLRPLLRDVDPDRRLLALQISDECGVVELRPDLVAIAIDRDAEIQDRISAGRAVARLERPHRTDELRALALDASVRGDDPEDELKGVALLASWPQAVSAEEVFSVLTPAKQRNLYGAYAAFIEQFRSDLTSEDVETGLDWLRDASGPSSDHRLGRLANRILELAASRPTEQWVIDAFARIALDRAEQHQGFLFEDLRDDDRGDPLGDPALRRAVAEALVANDVDDSVLLRLTERWPYSLGVVRSDDLQWLSEVYACAGAEARTALRSLFEWTFDVNRLEHCEVVLALARDHPLRQDLTHEWVEPVLLGSPEAQQMRTQWERLHGPRRPRTPPEPDEVNEEIATRLEQFDSGDASGFWYSMRLLTVAPGSKYFGEEFNPDRTAMPRWSALPDQTRQSLVEAAEKYVCTQSCEPERWLHRPNVRCFHPDAGYCALVLLLRLAPDRLEQLPQSAWLAWAPVLSCLSTAAVNGASWEDKETLLDLAGPDALAAARAALISHVEAHVSEGTAPSAENEANYLWNDELSGAYRRLAVVSPSAPREEVVRTVAKHDIASVRPLLCEWLTDTADVERFHLAVKMLVDHDLESSWPAVRDALGPDPAIAQSALAATLTVRGFQGIEHLPAQLVGDMYLWLRSRFPPDTDPQFDDVHSVGPREQIGHWRDKLLVRLRDLGTTEAVEAVRRIAEALPEDRWLGRTVAAAEAALRRSQWSPTPLSQLLELSGDRRKLLVDDLDGLSGVTAGGVGEIQGRLTGATPRSHLLWDSHSGRPKSEDEISDYLASELVPLLSGRGVVVNREVQIRRNRPSGIGERADILVEAAMPGRPAINHLVLPVEVKGAWNDDLLSAMKDQLVERYMLDLRASCGIYLVAWPGIASWTDAGDARRKRFEALNRSDVEADLADQAATMAHRGYTVRVIHLDVAYRRPE